MAADFFLGESLVGDGNEVAHVDLIIGSKSGPAGAGVRQRADEQQGWIHDASRRRRTQPSGQARHDPVQQGHDQGREAGRSDVRARAGGGRPRRRRLGRERRHPEGQGRRPRASWSACSSTGMPADDKKIFDYNYQATKESIAAGAAGEPNVDKVIASAKTAKHPFSRWRDKNVMHAALCATQVAAGSAHRGARISRALDAFLPR